MRHELALVAAAGEDDAFAAIYDTHVRFDTLGKKSRLVVTHVQQGLAATPTTIDVIPARRDAIPRPRTPAR